MATYDEGVEWLPKEKWDCCGLEKDNYKVGVDIAKEPQKEECICGGDTDDGLPRMDIVCPKCDIKPQNTDCWLECPLCHADLEGNTLIAHLKAGCQDKKQECCDESTNCPGDGCHCSCHEQEEPEREETAEGFKKIDLAWKLENEIRLNRMFRKDVFEFLEEEICNRPLFDRGAGRLKEFKKKYLPKGL